MSSEHGGWASPGPAGLVALAIACFCFFAVLTGKVPATSTPLLACWLFGGFLVQLCVALIELREGHLLGGNVFLYFSAFFMLTGAFEWWVRNNAGFAAAKPNAAIDGWAWIVLTSVTIIWSFAYFKTSTTAHAFLFIAADFGIFFVTLKDLALMNSQVAGMYAGYGLLVTGIIGIYIASAVQLNAAWGKTILPLGGPLLK